MRVKLLVLFIIFFSGVFLSNGQSHERTILWNNGRIIQYNEFQQEYIYDFDGAVYLEGNGNLASYYESFQISNNTAVPEIKLTSMVFETINDERFRMLPGIESIKENIRINTELSYHIKKPYLSVSFLPFRKNELLGTYEKLVSFEIEFIENTPNAPAYVPKSREYASQSVLANGDWYRVAVQYSGIHRISYEDLISFGINVNEIDPRKIKIHGYGGGMLPENSADFKYDDLPENAIYVHGEEDGVFNQGDYILFYGESPVRWEYNVLRQVFEHKLHLYSDRSYYFITISDNEGKRIEILPSTSDTPTDIITTFNDFLFHEKEETNLIKSGRRWFGEYYDVLSEYSFSFSFPNIDKSSPLILKSIVAARSSINSSYSFNIDGNTSSASITAVSSNYNSQYARDAVVNREIMPSGENININIKYNKTTSASIGWLDYIELNARRSLRFINDQMSFRDAASYGYEKIGEFRLSGANNSIRIWEVTDPVDPKQIDAKLESSTLVFNLPTDTLREFVAFNGNSYYSVEFIEKVNNQNLHGIQEVGYVIVSNPDFLDQAERLAEHHRTLNGLSTLVLPLQPIYNEFSSGAPDITAIRDFMKMLYDKAPEGKEPKYLLLFGDGSYDPKNRVDDNTNMVPTYQSEESFHPVVSYVTDDYFGWLDDGEGTGQNDMLDIGIGRLPVVTQEQASKMVDKIIHYSTPSKEVMGDWRNEICFIADDEDSHIHFTQAENLANYVDTAHPQYNLNKIYLDAYTQISTSGGQRYPGVNEAINDQVEKGALIVNYTGHGGEVGWAHERVLELSDINNWDNINNMPVFITATCEFSRFDDPGRTSAGEYVFLNPNGGGLALLTTSRATFGSPNYNLNKSIYKYAFRKTNGEYPALGSVLMFSKRESGSDNNGRKFILLGDPAMKLAYPEYTVVTNSINQNEISSNPDTLRALAEVTIKGELLGHDNARMTDYSGTLHTTVFDKPTDINTHGNDGNSSRSFKIQKSILYKGKTTVNNGEFSFTFIVPKDIAYRYDFGKISYYSENEQIDANGYYKNIIIGGFDENQVNDIEGPEIELFMNNEYFRNGGVTDENPVLLAIVSDDNGINTVGNGIGHDITAVLDKNYDDIRVLNDYYVSDLNTYKSGVIRYPFFNLKEGPHQIKFKLWDTYNNSSEASINFVVINGDSFTLSDLLNYPNPFSDYTYFTFQHNQTDQLLDVEILIFSLSGQLVKSIRQNIFSGGYRTEPIYWDGTDNGGSRLSEGMYIFRVKIINQNGEYAEDHQKLVIVK